MAEDLGERTEEATPRRMQQAREEGNVARSQDLSAALMLLTVTVTIWAAATWMLGQGAALIRHLMTGAARIAMPLLLVAWDAAGLTHLVQIGWLFSPIAVTPRFAKLNPLQGARRILGISGLVKAALDLLKVGIVVAVAVAIVMHNGHRIGRLPELTALQATVESARMLLQLALAVVAVLLLLGILDFMYQRWKHRQDLKMTKQAVQDELKQTEGDPETKRRRLRMQQQIAMQRVSSAVPRADVVVTNPQHVAVAIKYDEQTMRAPRVVAKGAEHLALRIRQIAMRHEIPIVERKPLARALYRQVAVNQEIPPAFYKAVAEILAYVYRLNGRMAG
jgi:flagellar biosynthetic protein FlhB